MGAITKRALNKVCNMPVGLQVAMPGEEHRAVGNAAESRTIARRDAQAGDRKKKAGTNILAAEVTNISPHGFWLLLGNEELAVLFSQFPWFKSATIEQLADVRRPTDEHLCWLQLDIDLSVDSKVGGLSTQIHGRALVAREGYRRPRSQAGFAARLTVPWSGISRGALSPIVRVR